VQRGYFYVYLESELHHQDFWLAFWIIENFTLWRVQPYCYSLLSHQVELIPRLY
jgi:hypothetical protein